MLLRENFLQNRMVDSDAIYRYSAAVHYNLKVPYICTQYVSFTTSQDEGLGQKQLVIKHSVKKVSW